MTKKINDKLIDDVSKVSSVQQRQMNKAGIRLNDLLEEMSSLSESNSNNLDHLEEMLNQAKKLINQDPSMDFITKENLKSANNILEEITNKNKCNIEKSEVESLKDLESIVIDNELTWDEYLERIENYASVNNIDLSSNPLDKILNTEDKKRIIHRLRSDYSMEKPNCDKYDYMIAAFSGVISGLIDSFFVGMPGKSKLGNWTDEQVDQWVIKLAKISGYKPVKKDEVTIGNAIAYFERIYKINYDQATGKSASDLLGMSMNNHHIKSLGHAPDLIGLLFSIIDQFSSTSHFLDNGRIIIFDTETSTIKGNNFLAKLFCGFSNWLGHLISDLAGSSSSVGRGSGIPMPLFELFQLIGKGSFKVHTNNNLLNDSNEMTFADLSVKVFEQGYDSRFGVTQGIPVIINELSIRLLYALKARYYSKKSWEDSLPFGNNPELRRILLTGHSVLCLVDSIDAASRSQGQVLLFALHLNFVAWKRLAFAGLVEVRALHKEDTIDLKAMDKDLEEEWNRLFVKF